MQNRSRGSTESALRTESCYRSFGPAGRESRWGCGFILKPTRGGYSARRTTEYIAVCVLRGTGTFTTPQGSQRVSPGCFCQHLPDQTYSLEPDYDGQWAEVYLVMDGPLYMRLAEIGAVDSNRELLEPGVDAGMVERFEQILTDLQTLPDSAIHKVIVRFVDLLVQVQRLDRSEREDPAHADLVDRACRRLTDDVTERLPLPLLAQELGAGYDHFRKIFTARTGISPGEYRIRRRIDRARDLILHRRLSNKEIADALGYPDPFSFSKQFHKVVGESPERFRRRMFG